MIVKCEQCESKFKLDDSKIKPEGVKVKCRKCGSVFTVMPEQGAAEEQPGIQPETPAPQESDSGEFDLSSFGATAEEEKPAAESASTDSGEFSWDQFNLPSSESTEAPQPEAAAPESAGGSEFGMESPAAQPEAASERPEDFSFEPGASFSFDEAPAAETPAEQAPAAAAEGGQAQHISDFDFDVPSPEEKVAGEDFVEKDEEFQLEDFGSASGETAVTLSGSGGVASQAESSQAIGASAAAAAMDFTFEERPEEPAAAEPQPAVMEEPAKSGIMSYLLPVIIFVLIGGAGTGGLWFMKQQQMEQDGNFGVSAVKTTFYPSNTPEQFFVVSGTVTNNYHQPKSHIKVRCKLLGDKKAVIAQKEVFAGNVYTAAELAALDYAEIQKGLNNKMGKAVTNVDVPPKKSMPFMVVFDKLPEGVVGVEAEAN